MKYVTKDSLDTIATGAAILGSGGGGSPTYVQSVVAYQLETNNAVNVATIDTIHDDDIIVPIACVGAPLIGSERIISGHECDRIIDRVVADYPGRRIIIMPAEIGGANALIPLIAASRHRLYILDGDLLGRAFPQVHMSAAHLAQIPPSCVYITDSVGNIVTLQPISRSHMEHIVRNITMAMGSLALISCEIMTGEQARKTVISGSLSRAYHIGKTIISARKNGYQPVEKIVHDHAGSILVEGVITDVQQSIANGFLEGFARIDNDNIQVEIVFCNENIIVRRNNDIVATTPDIIIPVDCYTGEAVTTESIRYGMRVAVICLSAPVVWTTEKGLSLVGPRCFGYDYDYTPYKGTL